MITSEYSIKNHMPLFMSALDNALADALQDVQKIILPEIVRQSPVDTGQLQAHNTAEIHGQELWFKNAVKNEAGDYYAAFVHLGTYKMMSNPFMLRACVAKATEAAQAVIKRLPK